MKQPNIIFILIDDMGWRDLSCFGSSFYETPNIDRLSREGMLFTQAYASCPVCSPSRASFLTGKYPARLQLTQFLEAHMKARLLDVPYINHLPLEEYTLPKALKKEGYSTWHVGKWHLGAKPYYPEHQGFDVNIGGSDWGHPNHGYFSPWGIETLPEGPEGEFLTDRLTDEAISLIEKRGEAPFFLYFSHYAVHTPIQAKPEDIRRFEEKARRMRLDQTNPFVEGEPITCHGNRKNNVCRRTVQSNATYAALIYNLDQNVGRLIEALKQQGIYDDTILFFTSDNGGLATSETSPTCNAPLSEGKGWMYDGGVREPLIVKAPGVAPNSQCHVPVTTPDFYPTILEMAGADLIPQQHVDGVSLMPLLRGEKALDRDAIYWHYPHYSNQGGRPGAAVRCGDYKLIKFFEDNHVELYNLTEDISESFNLADRMPELARELESKLMNWLNEVDGQIPQPNPDYRE